MEETTDGEQKEQIGNIIVEESTDGEDKVEVGEAEALKEMAGDTVFEESNEVEHTAPVRETEALQETMGNTIVESSELVRIAQVREAQALEETVGDTFVEESSDVEHTAQVAEAEALRKTMVDAIFEESSDVEHMAQVVDVGVLMGDTVVEENSDDEHPTQFAEVEELKERMDDSIVEESSVVEHGALVGEEALKETRGNTIVEKSSNVEHTARVGKEEGLNETMGITIVKERSDVKQRAEVREEVLDKTLCDVMVVESRDEDKAQDSREELLNKTAGNTVVKESTDGKHNPQVREEEVLQEKAGDVIVDDSPDEDNKAQGGKEDMQNKTTDNLIVEESADGEYKAEIEEEKPLNETECSVIAEVTAGEHGAQLEEGEVQNRKVGNVIVDAGTDGQHRAEIRKERMLDETMVDVIVEESANDRHKGKVREEKVFNETMGDEVMGESTHVEHMTQVGGEANERTDNSMVDENIDGESLGVQEKEVLDKTEKQVVQSVDSGARIFPVMENDPQVNYHLPFLDKDNFSLSDLVWGKVKSHPWWPGQIFDPSDATKLAMKYQKKDSFLIGYFGDKTFAWCDESQLKPFHPYFSQLEKQCCTDTFVKAIHDILTEVARRVELGMACSCLPEEDYANTCYQKVDNAGIRAGNISSIIDRPTVVNYFQADRLLGYIRTLAQFPNGRVDRLEFVIARSQLKAFYHSKGYPELPVFTAGGGLVESAAENPPSSGKSPTEDIAEHCTSARSDSIPAKGKSTSEQSSSKKQKHALVDHGKQKIIPKLTEDRSGIHCENGGKYADVSKAAKKPTSNSSGKKHIIVESDPVDSGRFKKRMLDSFEDIEVKSPSSAVTSSFRIGEFIRRAASQLTGGPPIVKCQGETLQKCGIQAESKKDDIADFDAFPDSPVGNQATSLNFIEDDNSTEEMLSQLRLAAMDPMEEFSFVSAIVAFFTGFRNFCVSGPSEETEHVEKRKRGRPRKVASQLAFSDFGSSEDDKHVEKRKRGMLTNVISQLASSDVSSEDEKPVEKLVEKPVEKRKRGRPRKNPQPVLSESSEDKKLVQKSHRGRPKGRPKKVNAQLACPDYSSSENMKPVEKRKRGRPRKVNTETAPSNVPATGHMKDSYWSDMDLQQKGNGKDHMQYQRKRRKSTGEQSVSLPLNPVQQIEQQLQLIAMNPNMKLTFIAERSIVSVEEKIVDECMPTALILSFNKATCLPSETDLIRIFSIYGPLKEAETEVLRKTNRAKVVFKRRVDAETAFSSAGKYSTFGPGLLSYQLKPWTPRSALQGTHQDTEDAASACTLQGTQDLAPNDNSDVASMTTPPDNHDAAFIATPQANHDTALAGTTLDKHDLASITMAQDYHGFVVQDNDDAAVIITLQDKHDTEPTARSNLEFSEQAEALTVSDAMQFKTEIMESSPYDKHDPASITIQQGIQDVFPITSSLDVHDVASTGMQDSMGAASPTIVQENLEVEAVMTLHETYDAGPTVGTMLVLSEITEDVIMSDGKQIEAEGNDPSSSNDKGDMTPTSQGNLDTAPPPGSIQDKLDVPIIAVQDNHDAIGIIRSTVESNFELYEKPESVITSDAIHVEDESKESSLHDRCDLRPVTMHQQNQDAMVATAPLDEQYATCTSGQDNLDAAPIPMEQDSCDAEAVITAHKCDVGSTVGSDIEISEQAMVVIASDYTQDETEDKNPIPKSNHDPALVAAGPEQYQDAVSVASLNKHDITTPMCTQGNLEKTSIAMVQNYDNEAAVIAPEDMCDTRPAVPSNSEISEQEEDAMAVDNIGLEPEVKVTLPESSHHPAPEQNEDAKSVPSSLDEHDSTPSTTRENLDEATISTPQNNHDEAPGATERESQDSEPIALPPQDNYDSASIVTARDDHNAASVPILPDHDAAPIATLQARLQKASVATPCDKHDLAPLSGAQDVHDFVPITTVQDNSHAVACIPLQEKCDAEPSRESNPKPSDQADDVTELGTIEEVNDNVAGQLQDVIMSDAQVEAESKKSMPHDNHDPVLSVSEQNQDTESIVSLLIKDSAPITTEDNLDGQPIRVPLDNHDPAPVTPEPDNHDDASITRSPEYHGAPVTAAGDKLHVTSITIPDEKHEFTPIRQTQGSDDLAPVAIVEDNHDTAAIIAEEDKCYEGPSVRGNLEHPEQAKDVMVSETIQVEAGDASLPEDKYDPTTTAIQQQNQDTESVSSLAHKHDSTCTATEDDHDRARLDMPEDNHDAAHMTTPLGMSMAAITGGGHLEVSEQADSGIASETVQIEAEGCKLELSEQIEKGTASDAMQA